MFSTISFLDAGENANLDSEIMFPSHTAHHSWPLEDVDGRFVFTYNHWKSSLLSGIFVSTRV